MDSAEKEIKEIKEQILHVCRRLYERNMVASNDGNVTVRVGEDRIIATPSGMSKGFLTADDLVLADMEGKVIEGRDRSITSEIRIYTQIYRRRPDVKAAVHAHPLYATAYAAAGRTVDTQVLPESALSLGPVALVPYATPGTSGLADQIERFLDKHEVFLLVNHGALALGANVLEAYHRMECLEHTARIVYLAEPLGGALRLAPKQIEAILEVYGSKTSEVIRRAVREMGREE